MFSLILYHYESDDYLETLSRTEWVPRCAVAIFTGSVSAT